MREARTPRARSGTDSPSVGRRPRPCIPRLAHAIDPVLPSPATPRLRARRGLHAARATRGPHPQRRGDARADPPGRRARRRPDAVPRARHQRVLARRPAAAGHAARRRRSRARDARGSDGDAEAGRDRRRAAATQRPAVQRRRRDRARPHPRRGAEVVPAELPRILRASLVRAGGRRRRPRDRCRGPARAVRYRSGLRRDRPRRLHVPRRDLRGLLGRDAAVDDGRARRRAHPVQPVGVEHRRRQVATTASCCAHRSRCAARPRTCTRPPVPARAPPTSRGTDRRASTSSAACSRRARASRPTARCASPTSTSSGCGSTACEPARTTTRPSRPTIPNVASGASASSIVRRSTTSGSNAASTASRSCPTIPRSSTATATRRSTSRSTGSCSGCRRPARGASSSASRAASTRRTR